MIGPISQLAYLKKIFFASFGIDSMLSVPKTFLLTRQNLIFPIIWTSAHNNAHTFTSRNGILLDRLWSSG